MPQYRWNILLKFELNSNQSILYIIVFNERILNKNIFSMNFKKTMKTVYLIKKKHKRYIHYNVYLVKVSLSLEKVY